MSGGAKDLDRVRKAKDALAQSCSKKPWFRGVGIAPAGDGYALRLNVDPDAEQADEAPESFQGIPVEIVRIGKYRPR